MQPNDHKPDMRQSATPKNELIRLAQAVLSETHRLVLPHHFNTLRARCVVFDEIKLQKTNVVGIDKGIYKTNIILLSQPGERPVVTKEQSLQDTVIIDISNVPATIEEMRHFLLETEECRKWHHAPRIVINKIKNRSF